MRARFEVDGGEQTPFTEGPRWHEGRLWFSDFYTSRVLAVGDDGQADTMAEVAEQPSGIGFLPDGDALIVSMRDRRILRRSADGSLSEHANLWDLAPWHLNDIVLMARVAPGSAISDTTSWGVLRCTPPI